MWDKPTHDTLEGPIGCCNIPISLIDSNADNNERWYVGAGVMDGPVVSSGHAMHVVHYAHLCASVVGFIDPHLDDRAYIKDWYAMTKIELPPKPKFKWAFLHLDLAVYDSANRMAFLVQQAWN